MNPLLLWDLCYGGVTDDEFFGEQVMLRYHMSGIFPICGYDLLSRVFYSSFSEAVHHLWITTMVAPLGEVILPAEYSPVVAWQEKVQKKLDNANESSMFMIKMNLKFSATAERSPKP